MKKTVFILGLIIAPFIAANAQPEHEEFFRKSMKINNTGMIVLGSWAIANMATGAVGWAQTTGPTKYFHQMNLFWNMVNLSIAGFALYSNLNTGISSMTGTEMLDKHTQTENLYLINAGLDVLYVGAGFYLKHLAAQKPKRHDMFKGYGNSVILQGSFLFLFDLVMYGIQHSRRMDFAEHLQLSLSPVIGGMQVGLTLPLN